jgi:hypothetical protein
VCFVLIWAALITSSGLNRFFSLMLALFSVRVGARFVLPLVGILAKWLIVGKYKRGRYVLWGGTYLRWWTVDQLLAICGRGAFAWFDGGLSTYYRLLGATIGSNVSINAHTKIGEPDLIEIGDNVVLDVQGSLLNRS